MDRIYTENQGYRTAVARLDAVVRQLTGRRSLSARSATSTGDRVEGGDDR
jgi:hypothetical protein